jgi:hypothetical protein
MRLIGGYAYNSELLQIRHQSTADFGVIGRLDCKTDAHLTGGHKVRRHSIPFELEEYGSQEAL